MHVARPYKGVFRDRIMCRSLASVDNSAVSLGHEHGDQFTCHTDARIRASRSASVLTGFPIGFQNRSSFVARFEFDTCCLHAIPSSSWLHLSCNGFVKLCALRVWESRRYLTQSRHLDTRNGSDRSRRVFRSHFICTSF